jgi:antitoxin Phd
MAKRWQLQDAKNRFSELVNRAIDEGPQTVTRHGQDVVVVISQQEFERRRTAAARGTILGFLRSLHFAGAELDLDRARDRDRDVEL